MGRSVPPRGNLLEEAGLRHCTPRVCAGAEFSKAKGIPLTIGTEVYPNLKGRQMEQVQVGVKAVQPSPGRYHWEEVVKSG